MKILSLIFLLTMTISTVHSEVKAKEVDDTFLLTIILKHHQTMNLDEIQKIQENQGFYKNFPPEGTSVVSWYVFMGIGQVVTLKVPANKVRDVNLAIERSAWKAFSSEFYPTYDLYPLFRDKLKNKKHAILPDSKI